MKNNKGIRNSAWLTALFLPALLLISCYDDTIDSIVTSTEAIKLDVNPKSFSQFDEDLEFSISSLSVSDLQVSSATIFSGATELGSASLTDNTGTVATTLTAMGLVDTEEPVVVDIVSTEEEGSPTASYEISLYNPTEASVSSTELEAQTAVNDTLTYTINTVSAVADNVIIEQKVTAAGMYEEVAPPNGIAWPVDEGSYIFKTEDFTIIKDTLYLKVTATKDAVTAISDEIKIYIETQKIDETSGEFSFTSDKLEFDLTDLTAVTNPEIIYVDPNTISAAPGTDITFAEITTVGLDIFEDADKILAEEAYAANTKTASITDIAPDKVYVYKINRLNDDGDTETFIGLLKIGTTSVLDGMGSFSIDISFLEEME